VSDAFEVIVVDDCSSDDTREYMTSVVARSTNLRYLRHSVNQGRSQARNSGIETSRGTIVICLDDDNVPAHDFVQAHVSYHLEHEPRRLAVVGNVCLDNETVQTSNFARFINSRYLGQRRLLGASSVDYEDLPGQYFGSLNCSARRSDIIAVGMFDSAFRHYGGEDEDLGLSLKRAGVTITFGENARTVHFDEITLDRYKVKYRENGRWGLRTLVDKHPDYPAQTMMGWLTQGRTRVDSSGKNAAKPYLQAALGGPALRVLERWAAATDGVAALYCPPVFRALLAGWTLQGYRSTADVEAVRYGEPPRAL
jgi:glycosyltransferase involved in cell wall biosynthesis